MEILSWADDTFEMAAEYWLIGAFVVGIFVVDALGRWWDQRAWTRRGRLGD